MSKNQKTFPRIVIAGTSSGVGKTTISLAVMAALTRNGLNVQGFKVGPDFIDPGYYGLVTGNPGRNLDTWMIGRENTESCFFNASEKADISVIEGVMGLYDGKDGFPEGSTSDVAKLVKSPVLLIIDCSKMGGSAGAVALGFRKYDEEVDIRGFLLNKVGSDRHETMVRKAVESATGIPVIGCVRRSADINIPERHLGLVTRSETDLAEDYICALHKLADDYIDLDAVLEVAKSAPLSGSGTKLAPEDDASMGRVRIGVAIDKAFSFYYHDNFDVLETLGAELVFFSPITDKHLPGEIDGLYLGGGYPEVYARELAANRPMALSIKRAVEDGMPVYAECGGMMYLSRQIEDLDGHTHEMCGALPVSCKMNKRPTLGYREVKASVDSIIARKGDILRGHEFHYSAISEFDYGLEPAYTLQDTSNEGFIYKNTLASYIHLHFAGRPEIAKRFLSLCRRIPAFESVG